MLRRSGRGLVIVLVGELWASGSSGQPIERRKRRDSRHSAGNAGTAITAPETPERRLSAGIAGSTLVAPKLSSTTPEERCVEVPVALQLSCGECLSTITTDGSSSTALNGIFFFSSLNRNTKSCDLPNTPDKIRRTEVEFHLLECDKVAEMTLKDIFTLSWVNSIQV